eukprot:Cvel_21846.t1-p1 / transcript=Cvel_21846.t1 / gene=Cvel_21846 / organism=Chromera_velia_CCMP2878 / gene_product=hypothetical protein / transcript_product=hypothetical protein / location=Cvel_scaffold2087:1-14067(-) / protein_length=2491 / sequence_SO=supercontig / SO=protein_coding / is_pseudo=false
MLNERSCREVRAVIPILNGKRGVDERQQLLHFPSSASVWATLFGGLGFLPGRKRERAAAVAPSGGEQTEAVATAGLLGEGDGDRSSASPQNGRGGGAAGVEGRGEGEEEEEEEASPPLEFDETTEELQVDFEEDLYMFPDSEGKSLRRLNQDVNEQFSNAVIGYKRFGLLNAYDRPVEFRVDVAVRHLAPLVQTLRRFTCAVPLSRVQQDITDSFGGLYQDAPQGQYGFFALERVSTLVLTCCVGAYQGGSGILQLSLLLSTTLALLCAHCLAAVEAARVDHQASFESAHSFADQEIVRVRRKVFVREARRQLQARLAVLGRGREGHLARSSASSSRGSQWRDPLLESPLGPLSCLSSSEALTRLKFLEELERAAEGSGDDMGGEDHLGGFLVCKVQGDPERVLDSAAYSVLLREEGLEDDHQRDPSDPTDDWGTRWGPRHVTLYSVSLEMAGTAADRDGWTVVLDNRKLLKSETWKGKGGAGEGRRLRSTQSETARLASAVAESRVWERPWARIVGAFLTGDVLSFVFQVMVISALFLGHKWLSQNREDLRQGVVWGVKATGRAALGAWLWVAIRLRAEGRQALRSKHEAAVGLAALEEVRADILRLRNALRRRRRSSAAPILVGEGGVQGGGREGGISGGVGAPEGEDEGLEEDEEGSRQLLLEKTEKGQELAAEELRLREQLKDADEVLSEMSLGLKCGGGGGRRAGGGLVSERDVREYRQERVRVVVPELGMFFEGNVGLSAEQKKMAALLPSEERARFRLHKALFVADSLPGPAGTERPAAVASDLLSRQFENALPLVMDARRFVAAGAGGSVEGERRLAATLQVISHGETRRRGGLAARALFGEAQDTFLSFYVNDVHVPPRGKVAFVHDRLPARQAILIRSALVDPSRSYSIRMTTESGVSVTLPNDRTETQAPIHARESSGPSVAGLLFFPIPHCMETSPASLRRGGVEMGSRPLRHSLGGVGSQYSDLVGWSAESQSEEVMGERESMSTEMLPANTVFPDLEISVSRITYRYPHPPTRSSTTALPAAVRFAYSFCKDVGGALCSCGCCRGREGVGLSSEDLVPCEVLSLAALEGQSVGEGGGGGHTGGFGSSSGVAGDLDLEGDGSAGGGGNKKSTWKVRIRPDFGTLVEEKTLEAQAMRKKMGIGEEVFQYLDGLFNETDAELLRRRFARAVRENRRERGGREGAQRPSSEEGEENEEGDKEKAEVLEIVDDRIEALAEELLEDAEVFRAYEAVESRTEGPRSELLCLHALSRLLESLDLLVVLHQQAEDAERELIVETQKTLSGTASSSSSSAQRVSSPRGGTERESAAAPKPAKTKGAKAATEKVKHRLRTLRADGADVLASLEESLIVALCLDCRTPSEHHPTSPRSPGAHLTTLFESPSAQPRNVPTTARRNGDSLSFGQRIYRILKTPPRVDSSQGMSSSLPHARGGGGQVGGAAWVWEESGLAFGWDRQGHAVAPFPEGASSILSGAGAGAGALSPGGGGSRGGARGRQSVNNRDREKERHQVRPRGLLLPLSAAGARALRLAVVQEFPDLVEAEDPEEDEEGGEGAGTLRHQSQGRASAVKEKDAAPLPLPYDRERLEWECRTLAAEVHDEMERFGAEFQKECRARGLSRDFVALEVVTIGALRKNPKWDAQLAEWGDQLRSFLKFEVGGHDETADEELDALARVAGGRARDLETAERGLGEDPGKVVGSISPVSALVSTVQRRLSGVISRVENLSAQQYKVVLHCAVSSASLKRTVQWLPDSLPPQPCKVQMWPCSADGIVRAEDRDRWVWVDCLVHLSALCVRFIFTRELEGGGDVAIKCRSVPLSLLKCLETHADTRRGRGRNARCSPDVDPPGEKTERQLKADVEGQVSLFLHEDVPVTRDNKRIDRSPALFGLLSSPSEAAREDLSLPPSVLPVFQLEEHGWGQGGADGASPSLPMAGGNQSRRGGRRSTVGGGRYAQPPRLMTFDWQPVPRGGSFVGGEGQREMSSGRPGLDVPLRGIRFRLGLADWQRWLFVVRTHSLDTDQMFIDGYHGRVKPVPGRADVYVRHDEGEAEQVFREKEARGGAGAKEGRRIAKYSGQFALHRYHGRGRYFAFSPSVRTSAHRSREERNGAAGRRRQEETGVGSEEEESMVLLYRGAWRSGARWGSGCFSVFEVPLPLVPPQMRSSHQSHLKYAFSGDFVNDQMAGRDTLIVLDVRAASEALVGVSRDVLSAVVAVYSGSIANGALGSDGGLGASADLYSDKEREEGGNSATGVVPLQLDSREMEKLWTEQRNYLQAATVDQPWADDEFLPHKKKWSRQLKECLKKCTLSLPPSSELSGTSLRSARSFLSAICGADWAFSPEIAPPELQSSSPAAASSSSPSGSPGVKGMFEELRALSARTSIPGCLLTDGGGTARLTWADGTTYVGQVFMGVPHGRGCLLDGPMEYEGGFWLGRPSDALGGGGGGDESTRRGGGARLALRKKGLPAALDLREVEWTGGMWAGQRQGG